MTGSAVSISGDRTPQYEAYAYLLEQPDAADRFKRLIHTASLPGQIYAMTALAKLDTEAFDLYYDTFYQSDLLICTFHGCSSMTIPIKWELDSIRKYVR